MRPLPIECELDQNGALRHPNVGDAEIRAITFDHPDVILHLVLPGPAQILGSPHIVDGLCDIRLVRCDLFRMTTDHIQNVVDSIVIFDDIGRLEPDLCRLLNESLQQKWGPHGRKVFLIKPIAGPHVLGLCEDVQIFLGEHPQPA